MQLLCRSQASRQHIVGGPLCRLVDQCLCDLSSASVTDGVSSPLSNSQWVCRECRGRREYTFVVLHIASKGHVVGSQDSHRLTYSEYTRVV